MDIQKQIPQVMTAFMNIVEMAMTPAFDGSLASPEQRQKQERAPSRALEKKR